jgi:type I restriction enzyme M protein
MLDTDTKRRIDTARDILVGKVPDPKSQVEQITIALIYKFMDDMDAEAEELGGKRKFFAGDYARYGWAKLMRSGLGGHETLNLYAEAIDKMPENPGIPPLFRDIFKNAYLPYRDPETLRAFLKIIDEFSYDHSERLGDAFEYLLSVLGSQGDAGQFRTPRHIIDFIVEVVDPKKHETVLDPACGTAGFLISSFKHILRANTDAKGHSTLTPDERGRLAANFKGYDISPDMVRLSLVNLYLHGFTDPHIYEYDTLTSQDRWNEHADVILANPPFMSPKGGIKPHNRFSVQSKRSEVLFVDYIAEHLTPGGRAGIIVPEGIIFQSQTAYTQLRKMLVEEYLVAVVSLPAGVFNPYSGVKTSILILDKALARQTQSIAFFKIENDGYSLGAQRREIDKNDLPGTQQAIREYLNMDEQDRQDLVSSCASCPSVLKQLLAGGKALVVPKEKIAANGDYNLSGERYREGTETLSVFPFVRVGDVFRKADESVMPETLPGPVTYIGLENITQNTGTLDGAVVTANPADIKSLKNVFKPGDILYGKLRPNLNKVWLADRQGICSTDIFVIRPVDDRAVTPLYAHIFRSRRFNDAVMSELKGAQLPRVGWASFAAIQIPLPPLEVQKEIVAEIEGYQKVIDGARAVLDNYRPHIPIHPDWPMVEVGELARPEYGFTASAADTGDARFIRITDIAPDGSLRPNDAKYISLTDEAREFQLSKGDILVARTGATYGKTMLFEEDYPAVFASYLIRLRFPKKQVHPRYYWVFAQSDAYWSQANALMTGGGQPQFNGNALKQVKLPLPPLETQRAIVAEIEAEQALVNANRELIARMEKKIQATLARIWGEDEPTPAEA